MQLQRRIWVVQMDKDLVFIVSGGRTGTKFLGDMLGQVIGGAFSVHEPDVFFVKKPFSNTHKIKEFGVWHLIIGRALGRTGIRNLNIQYMNGKFKNESEIIQSIHKHRDDYFSRIPENLIIESNYQWYGLLPLLRQAYPSAKIVAVVRDPRDWVVSYLNFGGRYDWRDVAAWLRQERLTPAGLGDEDLARRWDSMSSFEKLCWSWQIINETIERFVSEDSQSKLYKFEELFISSETDQVLDLLKFITDFRERKYPFEWNHQIRRLRINKSRGQEKSWSEWPRDKALQLDTFCGPLMQRYGYGVEPKWRAKLSK